MIGKNNNITVKSEAIVVQNLSSPLAGLQPGEECSLHIPSISSQEEKCQNV